MCLLSMIMKCLLYEYDVYMYVVAVDDFVAPDDMSEPEEEEEDESDKNQDSDFQISSLEESGSDWEMSQKSKVSVHRLKPWPQVLIALYFPGLLEHLKYLFNLFELNKPCAVTASVKIIMFHINCNLVIKGCIKGR